MEKILPPSELKNWKKKGRKKEIIHEKQQNILQTFMIFNYAASVAAVTPSHSMCTPDRRMNILLVDHETLSSS